MACWEFHRSSLLGPERWTWRALEADGSVKLSSREEFGSLAAATRNARQYGFEEGRDEWYVGSSRADPKQRRAGGRHRRQKQIYSQMNASADKRE